MISSPVAEKAEKNVAEGTLQSPKNRADSKLNLDTSVTEAQGDDNHGDRFDEHQPQRDVSREQSETSTPAQPNGQCDAEACSSPPNEEQKGQPENLHTSEPSDRQCKPGE